jgi:hypothetical protein
MQQTATRKAADEDTKGRSESCGKWSLANEAWDMPLKIRKNQGLI